MTPSSTSGALLPEVSFDGYIRLTFDAFIRLAFRHKIAWEDSDLGQELRNACFPACRAGYCEWDTGGRIAISVGWGWFATANGTMFIAPGYANSNLMFVTSKNYDLGACKTSELLRAWLSSLPWQPKHVLERPEAGWPQQALLQHGT